MCFRSGVRLESGSGKCRGMVFLVFRKVAIRWGMAVLLIYVVGTAECIWCWEYHIRLFYRHIRKFVGIFVGYWSFVTYFVLLIIGFFYRMFRKRRFLLFGKGSVVVHIYLV